MVGEDGWLLLLAVLSGAEAGRVRRGRSRCLSGACEPVGQHGGGGLPREPWIGAIEPERQIFEFPCPPHDGHRRCSRVKGEKTVEVVHVRCAGLDISKKDAKVCVRVAGAGRRKTVEIVTTWSSMTSQILALREHLIAERITCAVMEATGDYWKPFYYLLEDAGFDVLLVNSRHVKNLPGRKTDLLTELSRGLEEGYVRCRVRPVRFAACDRRWGYASGFVRAGGAAAGLSRGDGRSVSTVSAR